MEQQPLKSIVIDHPDTAQVFAKYGLDFCCGGNESLTSACTRKNLELPAVVDALQVAIKFAEERKESSGQADRLKALNAGALAAEIVATHHKFLREHIPYMNQLLDKVVRVHGDRHTELKELHPIVHTTTETLLTHLDDEENGLFKLAQEHKDDTPLSAEQLKVAQEWIDSLEKEHVEVGQQLQRIRELTSDYTPPADGCGSYRLLFTKLKQMEEDTHMHVMKENYVLFPKVLKLVTPKM